MRFLKYSLVSLVSLVCFAFSASPAFAGLQGGGGRAPGWMLREQAVPTNLPPGGRGYIEIELFNVGAAASNGQVVVTDVLPAEVRLVKQLSPAWSCAGVGVSTVTCTTSQSVVGGGREMPDAPVGAETIELEVEVAEG